MYMYISSNYQWNPLHLFLAYNIYTSFYGIFQSFNAMLSNWYYTSSVTSRKTFTKGGSLI